MFTIEFWRAAAERAVKTFAQAAIAYLSAGIIGFLEIDWVALLSVAGLASLISVLTSVASSAATGGSGPSLTKSEELTPPTD